MPKKYSPELRERAIRMVLERQATQGGPRSHSIRAVAPQLDVSEETLRMWCQRHGHEVAQAPAPETPAEEIAALAARCTRLLDDGRFPPPSGRMPALPWPLF